VVRQKEVRAAWARRTEGDGWSWKLLIPRPERPWMAWATFGVFGALAVNWFFEGTLWLAVPGTALCLISLVQGIWGSRRRTRSQASLSPSIQTDPLPIGKDSHFA
jgi:hypothetical protein